jgi:hypothetical protein
VEHDWGHVKDVLKNALRSAASTVPRNDWSETVQRDISQHETDGDTRSIGMCFWVPQHLKRKAATACGYTLIPHERTGNPVWTMDRFTWKLALNGYTERDVRICDKLISKVMEELPAEHQTTFPTHPGSQ